MKYEYYEPGIYEGRMTLFRAKKQPLGIYPDRNLGWSQLVAGGIDVHDVPGHHGSIVVEPNVRYLAVKLRASIDEAVGARANSDLRAELAGLIPYSVPEGHSRTAN